jgi:hypothetical protein
MTNRPARQGLRTFCTAMPVVFTVLAVVVLALAVPNETGGWPVGQEVLCAGGFLVLAGLLLWVRRLVVRGYVDVNIAVPRAKHARTGAFLTAMACLIGVVPVAAGGGPSAIPIMLTVFVVMSAFLTAAGLKDVVGSGTRDVS